MKTIAKVALGLPVVATLVLLSVYGLPDRARQQQAATTPAASRPLAGRASVIDGDTIEIHGERIRLHGIDAPESNQLCEAEGKRYYCGQKAAFALSDFLGARTVECRERSRDRWQRVVATCTVDGRDVGGWMVEQGWAIAYRTYSTDYVGLERQAQAERRGLWAGKFQEPEQWRRERR